MKNSLSKTAFSKIIRENRYLAKCGSYSTLKRNIPKNITFQSNFPIAEIYNLPNIRVINTHPLTINISGSVIVNNIGSDIDSYHCDEGIGIRDKYIYLCTDLHILIKEHNDKFPINSHCIYVPNINVIRNMNFDKYELKDVKSISLILASPILKPKLKNNKLNFDDFITTSIIIESCFQTAIDIGHKIIILSTFGDIIDNNPVMDIIKIYNACIYKYGHMFKNIIVAIPDAHLYPIFKTEIINIMI